MKSEILNLKLSPSVEKEIEEIVARYPDRRSAILPLLHVVQRENGYVTEAGMRVVASTLGLSPAQVFDATTFYTMFYTQPVGKNVIQVCKTLSCALLGADSLILYLERTLGIRVGETTPDGLFTLTAVECLASCGTAPMMQINDDYYEGLTKEKVDRILKELGFKAEGAAPR